MTTKATQIDKEALEPVIAARTKAVDLAQAAERAMKDARLAELEFKVQIQQLYLEKQLDQNCRVDINTGVVTWPEENPEEEKVTEDKPKRKPRRKTAPKKEETAETAETAEDTNE